MAASVGAIRAGGAYVELSADNQKLIAGLKRAEESVARFGAKASAIGSAFATLGAAAAAPLAFAVQNYAAFDDQMRVVQAVSVSTGEEFEALTAKARRLGATTSFTAAEVANAMAELGRAGFKAPQIDAAIDSVMNLSRSTQTEIPLATEIAGNALRAFDLEASETERVCDVLTATANNSSQTLEDLGEAFKFVAPIAADAGLSIEDSAKILGTLANFGIKGSLAGTAFKNIQLKMADPAVQKSYEELGVSVIEADGSLRNMAEVLRDLGAATASMPNAEKLATYQNLFSMYGLSGGIKLTNANFAGMYDAIDNSQGVAAKTAAAMDAGIGGAFRNAESAIEGLKHAIGDALTPKITELAGTLVQVAGETTAWIKENEDTVKTVASVAAGVALFGGSLLAVGTAAKVAASTAAGLRAAWSANLAVSNALTGATRKAEAAQRAESAAKEAAAVVEQKRAALDRANVVLAERATAALQAEANATRAATAASEARIATDAESAQITRLKAEITTRETAVRNANIRAIQAQTAAEAASVATSREAAKLRSLEIQKARDEITLRGAATKARLAESAAARAQAAVKSAVANKADAATTKELRAEAAKRAAVAQTAQAELKAAQSSVAATNRRIAEVDKEIAKRAQAAQTKAEQAVKEAESEAKAVAAAEKKIAAIQREIVARGASAQKALQAAQAEAAEARAKLATADASANAARAELADANATLANANAKVRGAATARQNEREQRDNVADSKVAEARLGVLRAMSGGGNVSAAMNAFRAAEAERETSRRENALSDAKDATTRFAAAQKALQDAEKSGDKTRVEAAREESARAAREMTSANSTLDEIIRGSFETAQKARPQLSSQGTFNAWEAGNFEQASPELEEMKRQTKILDRLERKFVFTGDDSHI